ALENFTTVKLADLTITNHKGEVKRTITNLEGVSLKEVLQKAEINSDSPKTLSEFYFVFTACDGYKVVYSWNEIFNNSTGNTMYLIKEKDDENISSITTSDMMTGRRYVQGLSTISIYRIQ
ncbi:MAG: molybdopterin-binding protein, partial [Bacteroidota bacterium]